MTDVGDDRPTKKFKAPVPPEIKAYVKKSISRSVETKRLITLVQANPDLAGSATVLSNIIKGDDGYQRDGNEVTVQGLDVRGAIYLADTTNFVRVIFFQWHENTAVSVPTPASILESKSGGGTPWLELPAHDERKTYTILSDRTYTLHSSQPVVRFTEYISARRAKKINYIHDANSAIGHIYVALLSDSGAVSHPAVEIMCGLRYKDE